MAEFFQPIEHESPSSYPHDNYFLIKYFESIYNTNVVVFVFCVCVCGNAAAHQHIFTIEKDEISMCGQANCYLKEKRRVYIISINDDSLVLSLLETP